MPQLTEKLNPTQIMQVGFGFWGSKVLLTAVELGVFTALAQSNLVIRYHRNIPIRIRPGIALGPRAEENQ